MKTLIKTTVLIYVIVAAILTVKYASAQNNNELWSISRLGGADGMGEILKMNLDGSGATKVYEFNSQYPGGHPRGTLCEGSDGKLYGTTSGGGKNNSGVIFNYDPSTTIYTRLYDPEWGSNSGIAGLMIASNGKLYGITGGGAYDFGSLISFDPLTKIYSKLFDFDGTNGKYANGALLEAGNGKLYGATTEGGIHNCGVIFSLDLASNAFSKVFDFDGINGKHGIGNLMRANDGYIYGNTFANGTNDLGSIFRFDPSSNTYSKLYDFSVINGFGQRGKLVQASNGKLYGMTFAGGANARGVIFSFNPSSNTFNKLLDFSESTGSANFYDNELSLTLADDGKLYGMAEGRLSLFSFDITSNSYSKVFIFSSEVDGYISGSSLMQSGNGRLYGMTMSGGTNGSGVLFSWDIASNTYQKQFDFNSSNGSFPTQRLVQANGKLYGMTTNGGAHGKGVIYSIDPDSNTYTNLLDFDGTNGANPNGSLMQANDGKLYGTTPYGGAQGGAGVLFSFDPVSNTFQKRFNFNFDTLPKGVRPYGSLIQATNGKLYGMTLGGSTDDHGTIFSFDPTSNIYNDLFDFDIANGAVPYGSLVQALNGKLYGMTVRGGIKGIYGSGVIFSFDPSTNTFSKLIDFDATLITWNSNLEQGPQGTLIQADDGKLYGTTNGGGVNNNGLLFSFDPNTNQATKLINFDGTNGSQPDYPDYKLMQASDGYIYGKTLGGGVNNKGLVYRFNPKTNSLTPLFDYGTENNSLGLQPQTSNFGFNSPGAAATASDSTSGGILEIAITGISISLASVTSYLGQTNNVSVNVGYTTLCNDSNIFIAQLSDSSGSLDNPITIGTLASKNSGTIICDIPPDIPAGFRYKIRVVSSSPQLTSNIKNTNLIKLGAPLILNQPVQPASALCEGVKVTFTVAASGGDLTYQWFKDTIALINAGNISGASSPTLTINSSIAGNTGIYSVVVTNAVGSNTSNSLSLIINTKPPATISTNSPVCKGNTINFSTGSAASYVWKGPNAFSSAIQNPIIDNAALTHAGTYSVTVTYANGCSTTAKSTVVVGVPLTPMATPSDFTICSGVKTAIALTSNVTATSWSATPAVISGSVSGAAFNNKATIAQTLNNGGTTPALVTYTIIATKNGCSSTILATATINPKPSAIATLTGATTNLCNSSSNYTCGTSVNATGYFWTCPAGATIAGSGTATTVLPTATVDFGGSFTGGTLSVKAMNGCGSQTAAAKTLTLTKNLPAAPATLTGQAASLCNVSANYTCGTVVNATGYFWKCPAGATIEGSGTATTTLPTVTVDFGGNFAGGVLSVNTVGICGMSAAAKTLALNNMPPAPATLTGNASIILAGSREQTYTCGAVMNTSGYLWTFPVGAVDVISGLSTVSTTDPTVTASFSNDFNGGTLSVQAINSCGGMSAKPKTLVLKRIFPAVPSTLTGPKTNLCNSSATFTCSALASASGYLWTCPAGATAAGSGTAITTNPTVTVDFSSSFAGGMISVQAVDYYNLHSTAVKTLALSNIPPAPATLTGSISVLGGTTAIYTCSAIANSSGYFWTCPPGTTIAGLGTATTPDPTVTVDFGCAFAGGTLSVKAINICGGISATAKTLGLKRIFPAAPATLTGQTTNLCNLSVNYICGASMLASAYLWTCPSGATIAGSGIATTTNPMVTVDFSSSFSGGTLSVQAIDACNAHTTVAKSLSLNNMLPAPATLTGTNMKLCNTSVTYNCGTVVNASGYLWSCPSGATIAGQSTATTIAPTVTVNIGNSFTGGTLTVRAVNACGGQSSPKVLMLTNIPPGTPGTITGSTVVCIGQGGVAYSVPALTGASYSWTAPVDATIAGQGTRSVTVNYGNNNGNVCVASYYNTCNYSVSSCANVTVNSCRTLPNEIFSDLITYPNPTHDKLYVKFYSSKASDYVIDIIDRTGRITMNQTNAAWQGTNIIELNLAGYTKGIYMLIFKNGEGEQKKSIVLE